MNCRDVLWIVPLAILLLSGAQSNVIPKECDGIVINGKLHQKEILKANVLNPYMLAVDYDNDMLFFSYSTNDEDICKSAFVNLKTKEFANISGIEGGFANAVDATHNRVYLGGQDGIYEFNTETKSATRLGAEDHNIWNAFYKNALYYTTYPDEEAFTYKDGKSEPVEKLNGTRAQIIVIDKDDTMFVSNSTGLYGFGQDDTVKFYGELNINGMTTDAAGNVYFSNIESIYSIQDGDVNQIATFDIMVFGVAVPGDGTIIYADKNNVIRLVPTDNKCN